MTSQPTSQLMRNRRPPASFTGSPAERPPWRPGPAGGCPGAAGLPAQLVTQQQQPQQPLAASQSPAAQRAGCWGAAGGRYTAAGCPSAAHGSPCCCAAPLEQCRCGRLRWPPATHHLAPCAPLSGAPAAAVSRGGVRQLIVNSNIVAFCALCICDERICPQQRAASSPAQTAGCPGWPPMPQAQRCRRWSCCCRRRCCCLCCMPHPAAASTAAAAELRDGRSAGSRGECSRASAGGEDR